MCLFTTNTVKKPQGHLCYKSSSQFSGTAALVVESASSGRWTGGVDTRLPLVLIGGLTLEEGILGVLGFRAGAAEVGRDTTDVHPRCGAAPEGAGA